MSACGYALCGSPDCGDCFPDAVGVTYGVDALRAELAAERERAEAAEAALAEARGEVAELLANADADAYTIGRLNAELAEARGREGVLREALMREGHGPFCAVTTNEFDCDCGRDVHPALSISAASAAEWRAKVKAEGAREALSEVSVRLLADSDAEDAAPTEPYRVGFKEGLYAAGNRVAALTAERERADAAEAALAEAREERDFFDAERCKVVAELEAALERVETQSKLIAIHRQLRQRGLAVRRDLRAEVRSLKGELRANRPALADVTGQLCCTGGDGCGWDGVHDEGCSLAAEALADGLEHERDMAVAGMQTADSFGTAAEWHAKVKA